MPFYLKSQKSSLLYQLIILKQSTTHFHRLPVKYQLRAKRTSQHPFFNSNKGYDYSIITKEIAELISPSSFYFETTSKYLIIRTTDAPDY